MAGLVVLNWCCISASDRLGGVFEPYPPRISRHYVCVRRPESTVGVYVEVRGVLRRQGGIGSSLPDALLPSASSGCFEETSESDFAIRGFQRSNAARTRQPVSLAAAARLIAAALRGSYFHFQWAEYSAPTGVPWAHLPPVHRRRHHRSRRARPGLGGRVSSFIRPQHGDLSRRQPGLVPVVIAGVRKSLFVMAIGGDGVREPGHMKRPAASIVEFTVVRGRPQSTFKRVAHIARWTGGTP